MSNIATLFQLFLAYSWQGFTPMKLWLLRSYGKVLVFTSAWLFSSAIFVAWTSVVHPSVKYAISETVTWIKPKFYGKYLSIIVYLFNSFVPILIC